MTLLRQIPRPRSLALSLAAATTLAGSALAQQTALDQRIRRIIDRPEFAHAMWGIQLTSLDSNRVLYALNETKLFTPGSTTKLVTEGTAMGVLGADYRFTTRVYRTGPVSGGVLKGDLVLVASGDPNLSNRLKPDGTLAFENEDHSYDADPSTRAVPGDPLQVLKDLAKKVKAAGITSVSGSVIVDASLFPEGDRELGHRSRHLAHHRERQPGRCHHRTRIRGRRRGIAQGVAIDGLRALRQQGGDRRGWKAAIDPMDIRFAHG
jgi:D-alanyl-D-alanine carboxypeptidase/D-alanyl-D-alanine-endopeptidase (penicillin-binding protein 4)